MKRNLTEELKRIHTITYGENITEEGGFLDKILKGVGLKDDPKKADVVEPDVEKFFETLETAAKGDGITQQEKGSMTFKKEVESMQIGLILLGYELPKYGVDGFFGPETAAAVRKFIDEKIENEKSVNEATLSSPIGDTSVNSKFGPRWGRMHAGVDLKASSGTQIKSPLDGEVIDAEIRGDACGGTIYIKHADDIKTRYCHCKQINVKKGDTIKKGEVIGLTGGASGDAGRGRSDGAHLHFEVYKSGKVVNPMEYLGSEVGEFVSGSSSLANVTATPEMLQKLIELLKEKGVSAEDLKKHVNKVDNVDINLDGLKDKNFYVKLLENLGAPTSDENLKFLYAWRQAEGKGGINNPFNTTWKLPNSTSMNSVGVKNYQTLEDGMVATIKTLKNGKYNCIVDGLKNDIGANNIAKCVSLQTWGTGDLVAKVVASYNSGSTPKIKSLS